MLLESNREHAVEVTIRRYLDDSQPGWVECVLVDAHGQEHIFREKVPVVSLEDLDFATAYPVQEALSAKSCSGGGAEAVANG